MVDVKYLHLYFVLRQRTSSKCDQPLFRMTPHHVHVYMTVYVCNPNSRDKFPHLSKPYSSYKQLFDCSFTNEISQNVCAVPSPDLSVFPFSLQSQHLV